MNLKDLSIIESDPYYSFAETLLEYPEIEFIFGGVREYMDDVIHDSKQYNLSSEDIIEFFKQYLLKANEFYFEYLFNLERFQKLTSIQKVEIIYQYLKKELPEWIYDETEYKDENDEDSDEDNGVGNAPYDVNKIDIINQPFEVESLYRMFKREPKELELSPDYQRNFVWKPRQKSRLIESILIRIPLPTFYLDMRNEDQWVVIDGLQRLTTIFKFMDNEFKLTDMQYLKELNGQNWKKLDRKYQRRIEKFSLLCNLVRPNTPAKIASNIFQRINTLGTKLEIQEIRNAMFRGNATTLLASLAKSPEFIEIITDKKKNRYSKRMEDHAIILRYLAFNITHYSQYLNNDMNDFLEKTMETINKMNDFEVKSLENDFKECMRKAAVLFEKDHFAKPSKRKDISNPVSKSLFESISYTLNQYTYDEIEQYSLKLREKIYAIYQDKEFILRTSVATNNPPNVKFRFDKFQEIFKEIIGH